MTTIQVCRTCLAHDTRMFTIVNSPLHRFYERITNSTCNMEDEKPLAVCYICYHLLQKYHRFTESAVKADEVLQRIYNSKIQITEKYMARIDKTLLFKFQMSPVLTVGIDSDNVDIERAEIKTEFQSDQGEMALDANKDTNQENTMDYVIKTETVLETSEGEDEDEDESCREDPLHSPVPSEFDDDEPLSSFSVNKEVVEKKSVPKKVTKGARGLQKRKLDQTAKSQGKLEVTSKEDVAAENSTKTLSKAGTMRRKLDRNTKPQEKLKVASKEDIGAENATNSIVKTEGFNLAMADHTDMGHNQSFLIEKINLRNVFVCKYCGHKFARMQELTRHLRTHTGEKPFTCNHCGKKFSRTYHLSCHSRIHTGEKPFECNCCGKKFTHKVGLTLHERTCTGEKPSTCNDTLKTFTAKSLLTEHERKRGKKKGENHLTCNWCGKLFGTKQHLTKHERIHTGEKPYTCKYCQRKFRDTYALNCHLLLHTGEKPFKCSYCEKSFTRPNHKTDHERTHTGDKPFLCNYCGKKFNGRNHLAGHERSHTGEKPFTCNKCGKKFTRRVYLRDHEKTQHADEQPLAKLFRKKIHKL